jgi:hypothetical protein
VAHTQQIPPVVIGYDWRATIQVASSVPAFPVGTELVAHVRNVVDDESLLTTLSTSNGRIVRVDDFNIQVTIPGSVTDGLEPGPIVFDLVRTDTDPDQYIGLMIYMSMILPVTRGLT